MKYDVYIGLEVHLQLSTKTKAFCSCATTFGAPPNTQTCPVCLGLPGALPVLNEIALKSAVKVALALNCSISGQMKFDRKNYYYPDLPKNFQISQYDKPLSHDGYLDIAAGGVEKRIAIKRVHMEEDAGKLFHKNSYSLVDYNRAGTPLLEIVSDPGMSSPEEAYLYLTTLKSILKYLDVSDCNMEEGSLRCDANISLNTRGSGKLGVKTELKNMNSFKWVRSALEYEIMRQSEVLDSGGVIVQETRLWNADKGVTVSMRSKEEAHDYRYFPEPDLVPFAVSRELIDDARRSIPELPKGRMKRLIAEYAIPAYDASVLTEDKSLADFFEEAVKIHNNPKIISNWIMGALSAVLNERHIDIRMTKLSVGNFALMIKMMDEGAIGAKIAKELLLEMMDTGSAPDILIESRGLRQISDTGTLEVVIDKVIKENKKSVNDYRSGKKNALAYLMGAVMKETRGKANPKTVNEILIKRLIG